MNKFAQEKVKPKAKGKQVYDPKVAQKRLQEQEELQGKKEEE